MTLVTRTKNYSIENYLHLAILGKKWKIDEKLVICFTIRIHVFMIIHRLSLTHFSSMFHFYTPWSCQKIFGFLTYSGGIEMEHWAFVKMPNISNLIGQNRVHISDIFLCKYQWNVYHANSRRKKNSFGKEKIWKISKQSKPSNVITYNFYNIYNSYK